MLVLGSTGVMGQRVVRLAREWIPHALVLGGSRHPDPEEPEAVEIDIADEDSLSAGLSGARVVINCVGPFSYAPEPLVAACQAAGCDLIDIADDLDFIRRSSRAVSDDARIRVVSGCSTVPGLVELLKGRWDGSEEVTELRVTLSMGTRNPVSGAMLHGLVRPLGRAASQSSGFFWRLEKQEFAGELKRLSGRYPSIFDEPRFDAEGDAVRTEFRVGLSSAIGMRALSLAAPLVSLMSDPLLATLCRLGAPVATVFGKLGSRTGILLLEAINHRGRVFESLELRAESAGLDIPASPPVWAARAILEDTSHLPFGALSLGQIITWEQAEAWLSEQGFALSFVRRE